MVNYLQSEGGYFYEIKGKVKRISENEFLQKGGETIISNNKNSFSNNINKNKQNFCLYQSKNKKLPEKIISNEWLNNSIDEDNTKVFYYRNNDKILAFIIYTEDENNFEKSVLNNKNQWVHKSKKFKTIFIEILCSNINYKGKGTQLMNEFLEKNYNNNTVIMLHPATESLVTFYQNKLKYPLAAQSNNYDYVFYTPNKELLEYLELENLVLL